MTLENILLRPSRSEKKNLIVQRLKIISFTHKTVSLSDLSKFYVGEDIRKTHLAFLRDSTSVHELVYLATCNRVEFVLATDQNCDREFLKFFFKKFNPRWTGEDIQFAVQHATVYEGDSALHHLFSVASSLDSMVVGEREIIAQVRKAYDECSASGLTGDFLRLVIASTLTTARQVYTETRIATHPVSIVSLAYRSLRDLHLTLDSKILMIGAGETNTNLSKYLIKHGFRNFSIFNRSLLHAEKLAASLKVENGDVKVFPFPALDQFSGSFDVLITCTAATEPVIRNDLYRKLLKGDVSKKIIIDLAMPADVDKEVIEKNNIFLIDLNRLKAESEKNLVERHQELKNVEMIIGKNIVEFHRELRIRRLEAAMTEVPEKIREIKSKAMNDVFAKEIATLDEHAKELLGKILDYVEKKCISVPMVMAKEIILENT